VKKTKRLVNVGPYGVVRNPMMWGIGTLLIGLALTLGSVGLWFGFVLFLLFISWFVLNYEEPDMERRFGEEYREYCRQTPRWWPLPPWRSVRRKF
jgi:protein-S-isoprenylcysteine O-methyltransferase Ste14